MKIFETTVKGIGLNAELFKHENLLILFGENAPDTLADYCFNIEMNKSEREIKPGMTLKFDEQDYKITAVGEKVKKNLDDLGHITIKFDGSTKAKLPGTLYVEEKEYPVVQIGTKISIIL
ncbi:PTS glucitol/sorbitol transporter subunit IIA [Sporanaerobacter sp. PP17-6a]|uniref:PTS glucitol/sorbitol transporter subunit IIA n=1 Tax=Sporanaerobacter sp. PP17-6a TaxID=1891289 RepID=UPI0008A05A7F|nr:PTS glucitol/sorbitol transporter subunit IIA [Sporanaerobacter sp. PP17-6a]SCL86156.1 PTS system glucitol/sorbitol-specific transporter subunit IIA [Sporanaerobacter sp. PP17-6a]